MLNRHLLRIKVMQCLYALKQNLEANKHVAIKHLEEVYAVDLNTMEPEDPLVAKTKLKKALRIFSKVYNETNLILEEVDQTMSEVIMKAVNSYQDLGRKDKSFFEKSIYKELKVISTEYYKILNLLILWSEVENDLIKEKKRVSKGYTSYPKFHGNRLLKILIDNPLYQEEITKDNSTIWNPEIVRPWFKEIVKVDEEYKKYTKKENLSFAEEKEFINYIIKKVVFSHEAIQGYMENEDLRWVENSKIVKSMVLKTFKKLDDDSESLELIEPSQNWEDDRDFVNKIYTKTLAEEDSYEDLIEKHAKNWAIDRLAETDRVIIKMAISEMIHCPSIPVKVTINEYIELSKKYSTPKSKQFINGVLDMIAKELVANGKIKKSGRGLIDNK